MDTDWHIVFANHITFNQGNVLLVVFGIAEKMQDELTVFGRDRCLYEIFYL